ncbi:MAG: FAD-binding oxidoreductase [Actinomycetota bacterium]|nr:FAD-binding oxidoreductase [Actinomycetota bacterium]
MITDAEWDVARLAGSLRAEISGTVSVDAGTKALYAVDASNYRAVPDLVVLPTSVNDLAATVMLCADAGAPVTLRGGGTSMAGNAIGGVVVDVSRHLNLILDIDPTAGTAVVEPGVVLTDLLAAAAKHRLTFGADPSSASRATLAGMIANNACGAHSVAWGTTADNLRGLDLLLADGERMTVEAPGAGINPAQRRAELCSGPGREGQVYQNLFSISDDSDLLIRRRFGQFSRQISGYALHRLLPENGYDVARLLCGSEGTLATTLRATVALTPMPAATVLLALGFANSVAAADSVPHVLPHGPLTMESINATLVDRLPEQIRREAAAAGLPGGQAWLLVEVGGDSPEDAAKSGRAIADDLRDSSIAVTSSLVADPRAQSVLWRCRRDGTGLATRRVDGAEAWGGWEDAAVPPPKLGAYLRGLDELLAQHSLSGASYGHFGEGCMHMRIDFDLLSDPGVVNYRSFVEQATDLAVSLGGSVSGEHGDGRARSELLRRMYGDDAVDLFAAVKQVWDPTTRMNPHVIVDPPPIDVALRHIGPAKDRKLLTVFAYGDDAGSFTQAQRRCVGVGKCRQTSGGVMCPSYQVTRDEQHSTRGRAHLLWEMLEGDLVTDGWRSTEVRDALDLCLSCKGCLSDCPVNVDMATYKAEFTHHHYKGRPWARPRSHWSMGWLPLWSRMASHAPGLANAISSSGLQGWLKRLGGVTQERELPKFAATPFTDWFATRAAPARPAPRGRVVLWPDTFTNFLSPEVGQSAVRVLENAGFEVVLPPGRVCCGLTWISTGQLGVARKVLGRSLSTLEPYLVEGVPIVGLEPSCTAVFRHDAKDLLPDDALARAAARSTYTFAEALQQLAPDWSPPKVDRPALVQVHCHQHAVMGFDADSAVMSAAGILASVPDSGCCGLAGNFGFEEGHYDVSQAAGERVILPAVREAAPGTSVLADGFSCRTQISQGTSRRAHHLAEILASALDPPPSVGDGEGGA